MKEVETTAMDCRQFQREVGEYPDRAIPEERKEAIEAHAAACAPCARDLRVFRTMAEGFGALPPLTASRDFEMRLSRRLSQERSGTSRHPIPFPSWARWVAVGAAAAFVLAFGGLLLRSGSGGGPRGLEGVVAKKVESSVVDRAQPEVGVPTSAETRDAAGERRATEVADARDQSAGLDSLLDTGGETLGPPRYVIDRPSDLPLLLPGGVDGEPASVPITF